MDQPVALAFAVLPNSNDLRHLPQVLKHATALQGSVLTMRANYAPEFLYMHFLDWGIEGDDAVKQYLALPLPQLRGVRLELPFSDNRVNLRQISFLKSFLNAGPALGHLQRLTLFLWRDNGALSLDGFFSALCDMPRLTSLSLECVPWPEFFADGRNLRSPSFRLRSFATRSLFPGGGVLLRNSCDTLRTLALPFSRLRHDGVSRFLDPHGGEPLVFHTLRVLDMHASPESSITSLIACCPRLERMRIRAFADPATFEDYVSPALAALPSPLKHLQLPCYVYRWESKFPRFIQLVERMDSPLRNLRTFSYGLPLTREGLTWRLRESRVFRSFAARRVVQLPGPDLDNNPEFQGV